MTLHLDLESDREVAVLRRLLTDAVTERGDDPCRALLRRLAEEEAREAREQAEWAARAGEHAEHLLPVLREAQERGTFVAAGVLSSLTPGEHDPFVHARADCYWAGALRVLAEEGHSTQVVVRERRGGVDVVGYRLADWDSSVPVAAGTVWREGGRCAECGVTSALAALVRCRRNAEGTGRVGHDFGQSRPGLGDPIERQEMDDGGT